MTKAELKNVMQGSAQVFVNGERVGYVQLNHGGGWYQRGWYAFRESGQMVSLFPSPKRQLAVNELVNRK